MKFAFYPINTSKRARALQRNIHLDAWSLEDLAKNLCNGHVLTYIEIGLRTVVGRTEADDVWAS
jgi:hypothetical protein